MQKVSYFQVVDHRGIDTAEEDTAALLYHTRSMIQQMTTEEMDELFNMARQKTVELKSMLKLAPSDTVINRAIIYTLALCAIEKTICEEIRKAQDR